jgi:hypothetical protein
MASSVAPALNIPVAAECRSRWAPRDGGLVIPARFKANRTTSETACRLAKARYGANDRRTIRSSSTRGRPCCRYSSSASAATWGSGSRTVRRPLPQTRSVPSSHETSLRCMLETSLARRPRRARKSKIALSRMPWGFVRSHDDMGRSTSADGIYRGSVDSRHRGMDGIAPSTPGRQTPCAARNLK